VVPGVGVGWFVLVGDADGLSVVDGEGVWDGLADAEVDEDGEGVGLFGCELNPPVAM
jgi:hypothetical protein